MLSNNLIFVISGPSGSGKTTLISKLLKDKELKNRLVRSISFTTRPPRAEEKDKSDYFFITEEEFKKKLKEKKILEWTRFLDYYYGTSWDYFQKLLKKKRHIILCLDEKGAFKIKKLYPQQTVTIFILPPAIKVLEKRICHRDKKLNRADLLKRMALAKDQLRLARFYDYRLVNDDFKQSLKELKEIIIKEINFHNYGRCTFRKTH